MERQIGKTFTDENGVKLIVEKEIGMCLGCYYYDGACNRDNRITGECAGILRTDRKGIIFKKLDNE